MTEAGRDGKRRKVGLVLEPAGVEDPYSRGAYLGLEQAVQELGVRGRVLTPAPKEGYVPSLSLLARQQYDLVIGVGSFAAQAVDAVATRFADARFAIVDAPHEALEHRPPNVQGIVFSEEEAGYLAGYLAALGAGSSTRENTISAIGGQRVPSVGRFIDGYMAGAKSCEPGHQDAHELHGRLPRPGQGAVGRGEPDRQGIAGDLPGCERQRARCARGSGRARESGRSAWTSTSPPFGTTCSRAP